MTAGPLCKWCGAGLKPLLTSLYCPNDCDKRNNDENLKLKMGSIKELERLMREYYPKTVRVTVGTVPITQSADDKAVD